MRLVALVFVISCGSGPAVDSSGTSAEADASLIDALKKIKVTITPNRASIAPGEQLQLTAKVSGTSDRAVSWRTNKGKVDPDGLYTAPAEEGSYEVTATGARGAEASVSIVVTRGTDGAVDLTGLPKTCHRDGQSLMRVTIRVDEYMGTKNGRNGVHELLVGQITHFAYNEDPSVIDTHEVHVAMNIATETNSSGLPEEIPLAPGSVVEMQGVYIPDADTDTLDMAVLHFTHEPCGYVIIDGQKYE